MLELIDLHTYYGESHILNGVFLKADEGSIVALLGRNGMGKTTMAHSIVGFTPSRKGSIRFRGEEIQNLPANKISKMGLGLVPQGRRLFPSLTVQENLKIAERGSGWTYEKVCALFPIIKNRSKHKANQLSGGEQQMVSIARALLTNPDFLIMDEPSEGLAPLIVKELGNIIKQLKDEGLTILLIEQNVSLALDISDYTYIMYHGQIAHGCEAMELAANEKLQCEYIGISKYKD